MFICGRHFKSLIRELTKSLHINRCIYLIDPDSVVTASMRRAQSSLPTKSRSEVFSTYRPITYDSADGSLPTDDPSTAENNDDRLTLSPADVRVIRRLSTRVNVLPIVARADVLTDEKLTAVKLAIRRGLHEGKLDFGVFGPATVDKDDPVLNGTSESHRESVATDVTHGSGTSESNRSRSQSQSTDEGIGSEESSEEEERQPRSPVVKLNPLRRLLTRSTSRSRLERRDMEEKREPLPLEQTDPESLATVRFSAHFFAEKKSELNELMPFAVIMPEQAPLRVRKALRSAPGTANGNGRPVSGFSIESSFTAPAGIHHDDSGRETPTPTPTLKSPSSQQAAFLNAPPQDLKGMFVRQFRWGTVDVLDPMHCDFSALRNAILSTHLKVRTIRVTIISSVSSVFKGSQNQHQGSSLREIPHREAAC